MRARFPFTLALAAAACIPEPAGVEGKLCSDSSLCGDGYVCSSGRCAVEGASADAGPMPVVDLMPNGGFEAGADSGWSVKPATDLSLQGGTVHSGTRALRISAAGFDLFVASPDTPAVATAEAGVYCARAFVSGTGLTTTLRVVEDPGPTEQLSEGTSAATGADWQEIRSARTAAGGKPLGVALAVQGHASAGSKVYLDDVRLWRSSSAACPEP
jgi:hypothetical protein